MKVVRGQTIGGHHDRAVPPLPCRRRPAACSRRERLRRRQAEGNPHRLGDLQPGLDGAQGEAAAGKGIRQGRHRHPSGCRRSAPTRRSNSSTPARSISARPPAPPRSWPRSTAIRSSRSTSIRARSGRRWSPRKDYADHQDRRPQGQARRSDARHRSAHLPGACAAVGGADREGHHPGAAAASGRQDRAHPWRRRRLGGARPDDGAGRGRRTAPSCSTATRRPIPGASSMRAKSS